jgi:DNA-directed RNA polymerase II subunit RPB1
MGEIPPLGRVEYIQTFLPTAAHIRASSVKAVETAADMLDPKLGVVDWGESCATCKSFMEACPGHQGHLEMPIPIYRVFFVRQLLNTLNVICFRCRSLRISAAVQRRLLALDPKERLAFLVVHSKAKCCSSCTDDDGSPIPHVVFRLANRDGCELRARVTLTDRDKQRFEEGGTYPPPISPADIFRCLSSIPQAVQLGLGCGPWNEPSALMWDVLPIPSLNTRPRHTFAGVGTGDKQVQYNDWTKILRMVVAARNELVETLATSTDRINVCTYTHGGVESGHPAICFGAGPDVHHPHPTGAVTHAWQRLNQCVAAFHSFRHKKFINKNGVFSRPLLNVEDRFKYQKSGRLRGNVIARRVNHAMRGVLEGDIFLQPDQVGIPRTEVMVLGRRVCVNALNARLAARWIANGPDIYPGANYITLLSGEEVDLRHHADRRRIQMHTVRSVHRHLLDDDVVMVNRQPTLHKPSMMTFRVRVVDGYAIRLHYAVFTPMAADCDGDEVNVHVPQTLEAIAEVSLLSRVHDCVMKDGRVWVKFIQNAVVGAFLLTRPTTTLSEAELHDATSFLELWEYPEPATRDPEPTWTGLQVASLILPPDFCLDRGDVRIINGVMRSGQLTAAVLNGSGGLLEHMYRDYADPGVTLRFLYHGYLLFQRYLDQYGLSAGYDDCSVDAAAEPVHAALAANRAGATRLSRHVDTAPPGAALEAELLRHNEALTSTARSIVSAYHYARDRGRDSNGVLQVIASGAKGSDNMLNQMCGMLGQVYVMHERYRPTTSHFRPGRDSLLARGFIRGAYSSGMGMQAVVAEAHAACESTVNKNRGTARSGYTMRKLTTCMMGVVVDYRHQVVDTTGRLLWGVYGNDGYDPARLHRSAVRLLGPPPETVAGDDGWTALDQAAVLAEQAAVASLRAEYTRQLAASGARYDPGFMCSSPVDFGHLLWRCIHRPGRGAACSATPVACARATATLWTRLVESGVVTPGNHLFRLLYLDWLSIHSVCVRWRLGEADLRWVGDQLAGLCRRSMVTPGESVGVNATQCLGEPFTQMSLKTPHRSGKFNTASGSARIANLVDGVCPDPTMLVVLKASVTSKRGAVLVGVELCTTYLRDIAPTYPVVRVGSSGSTVHVALDRQAAVEHGLTPRRVYLALCRQYGLAVDGGSASMADSLVWELELHIPTGSALWTAVAGLCGPSPTPARVVGHLAWNLWDATVVSGLQGVSNFAVETVDFPGLDGGCETRWAVLTMGSDVRGATAHPSVDGTRSTSSDCAEMGRVFGIHAARRTLEAELSSAMCGLADTRHIKLITRMMASTHTVQGMKVKQIGQRIPPLQRAAYEHSTQQMSEYCAAAERDYAQSICGAALANRPMKVGTGFCLDLLPAPGYTQPPRPAPIPQMCRYVCSPKVDGVRVTLVFTADESGASLCSLVDRRGVVRVLSACGLVPEGLFCGTVLDGDLVVDAAGVTCFVVFDCTLSYGSVLSRLMYPHRLEVAREIVYRLGTCDGVVEFDESEGYRPVEMCMAAAVPSRRRCVSTHSFRPGLLPFHICVKPIFDVQRVCSIPCDSFHFATDGFVFTDRHAAVTPFRVTPTSTLKWKPVVGVWDENTIDVRCREADPAVLPAHADFTALHRPFRVAAGEYEMVVCDRRNRPVVFAFGEGHPGKTGVFTGVGVYEFAWNRVERTWHLIRRREKAANTLETVLATLVNIVEAIRLGEIQARVAG